MEFVKITKNGKVRKMLRSAWEDNMPVDKNGWSILPDKPKELSEIKGDALVIEKNPPVSNNGGVKRGPKPKNKEA